MKAYPFSKWKPLLEDAHKTCKKAAKDKADKKKKPLINALYNELNLSLSAKKAAAAFYSDDGQIDLIKKQNEIIDEDLRPVIKEIFENSRERFGAPKIQFIMKLTDRTI